MNGDTAKPLRRTVWILILCFFAITGAAHAHNQVVVIPMSGDDARPLQNVISVAKSNGDFDDPIAALASISDEGEDNPYLIVIAPGVYELSEQLVMREFIDISGAGQTMTRLLGSVSDTFIGNSAALVVGANNTTLRGLTIENRDGENGASVGMSCEGLNPVSPKLIDLALLVSGGREQVGLSTGGSSFPVLEDVRIDVRDGGGEQSGVLNKIFGNITATRLNIVVENGGNVQHGIQSFGLGRSLLNDSSVLVRGGAGVQFGVLLEDSSLLEMRDSRVSLSSSGGVQAGVRIVGGALATVQDSRVRVFDSSESSIGISIAGGSSTIVRGSTINGSSRSISVSFSSTPRINYISDSFLSEEPFSTSVLCSFVFLEDGTPLNNNCND